MCEKLFVVQKLLISQLSATLEGKIIFCASIKNSACIVNKNCIFYQCRRK